MLYHWFGKVKRLCFKHANVLVIHQDGSKRPLCWKHLPRLAHSMNRVGVKEVKFKTLNKPWRK